MIAIDSKNITIIKDYFKTAAHADLVCSDDVNQINICKEVNLCLKLARPQ